MIQNHSGAPAGHGGAPKVHAEGCAACGGVEGGQLGGSSGGSKGGGSDGEEEGGDGEGGGNRGGGGRCGGADGSDPVVAIFFGLAPVTTTPPLAVRRYGTRGNLTVKKIH